MMSTSTIIREINGLSLEEAKTYIARKEKTINRICINVFRDVLADSQKNVNILDYVNNVEEIVVEEEHLEVVKDGIFRVVHGTKKYKTI